MLIKAKNTGRKSLSTDGGAEISSRFLFFLGYFPKCKARMKLQDCNIL